MPKFYMILAWKITKIPKFLYLPEKLTKFPNFTWFLPENAQILHKFPKHFFPNFRGHLFPVSYTYGYFWAFVDGDINCLLLCLCLALLVPMVYNSLLLITAVRSPQLLMSTRPCPVLKIVMPSQCFLPPQHYALNILLLSICVNYLCKILLAVKQLSRCL